MNELYSGCDCGNCTFYVSGFDDSDRPCFICSNPDSYYFRASVCINDTCSRFRVRSDIRSCKNCVHSSCVFGREFCLDCFGSVTNFSEFVPVASVSVSSISVKEKSGVPAF